MSKSPKTKSEPKPVDVRAPRVVFASEVLLQIRQHAASSMQAEICGVLIGREVAGSARVTARIIGEGAAQGGAHVTFTQDTWEHIFKIKDKEFPEDSIVGWYHSHPGFGIFLSDYDLFIHKNFFAAPHQIAWVHDPHSGDEGCFGWVGSEIEPLEEVAVLRKYEAPPLESATNDRTVKQGSTAAKSPKEAGRGDSLVDILIIGILAFGLGFFARPHIETFFAPPAKSIPEEARVR